MRILLVNQYAPPDPSPTARLLDDLARRLEADGHETRVASAGHDYRRRVGGGSGRWVRESLAVVRLLAAMARGARPDVLVALSSPPGLVAVAALVAAGRRARLVHWVMDLYPEIAVALGALPGPASGVMRGAMRWGYRRCERVIALDADMAGRLRAYGVVADILPPWVPGGDPAVPSACHGGARRSGGLVWLYSGNLGRAHEWRALVDAQALLEERGVGARLVFQGDGPQFGLARDAAALAGLRGCEFRGYARDDALLGTLLGADIVIATQNPATVGCLWPSKLALACALPRPILWVGPTDSAISNQLRENPANGVFGADQADAIADWVADRADGPPAPAWDGERIRGRLAARRADALDQLVRWITCPPRAERT